MIKESYGDSRITDFKFPCESGRKDKTWTLCDETVTLAEM